MLFVIVAYLLFPLVGVVLALRIFHGIGWGLSSTSTSTIVADVIPKVRFAEGMGWYALGGSLSAAIGPALSIFLLEEVGAQAMIFVASASLGIAFVLSLLVEDQAMSDKNNQAKHESAERSASSISRNAKPKLTLDSLIERDAWLPSLGILLVNAGFAAITAFIAVYGMAQGVANISLYFVVYSLVTIVSRPIIGRIIDQKGFFVPSVLGTLCVGDISNCECVSRYWYVLYCGCFCRIRPWNSSGSVSDNGSFFGSSSTKRSSYVYFSDWA